MENNRKNTILTIILVAYLIGIGILAFVQTSRAKATQESQFLDHSQPIWQVLMAEAVSEGYDGMYAVACVIRNRGGNLNGFYGAKRKDLDAFCQRNGVHIPIAKAIERAVFSENSRDTTGGATHFENIEAFGTPYWAVDMRKTCKIGRHTFYKKRGG